MALLDDDRRHVEVNGSYLQLLGFPRAALVGHPVYEFITGGPMLTARQWHAVLRLQQFVGVAEFRREDGARMTAEFAGHPESVTGRRLVLVVVIQATRWPRTPTRRGPAAEVRNLTPRELEVVELVALGLSGPEIGVELHLAHNTVRTHIRNAMSKLDARSRAQLVARALGEGLTFGART